MVGKEAGFVAFLHVGDAGGDVSDGDFGSGNDSPRAVHDGTGNRPALSLREEGETGEQTQNRQPNKSQHRPPHYDLSTFLSIIVNFVAGPWMREQLKGRVSYWDEGSWRAALGFSKFRWSGVLPASVRLLCKLNCTLTTRNISVWKPAFS
jgi:hypothetical protein